MVRVPHFENHCCRLFGKITLKMFGKTFGKIMLFPNRFPCLPSLAQNLCSLVEPENIILDLLRFKNVYFI